MEVYHCNGRPHVRRQARRDLHYYVGRELLVSSTGQVVQSISLIFSAPPAPEEDIQGSAGLSLQQLTHACDRG